MDLESEDSEQCSMDDQPVVIHERISTNQVTPKCTCKYCGPPGIGPGQVRPIITMHPSDRSVEVGLCPCKDCVPKEVVQID